MSSLRTAAARLWTRDSSILLGGFLVTIFLIVYIWWPLAEEYLAFVDWSGAWWHYIDWLLLGIFGFMSLTIISQANLKRDLLIFFVRLCGGLAIDWIEAKCFSGCVGSAICHTTFIILILS